MNETLKLPLIMVGPQYEPDERTFMAVEYFKRCGKRDFMGGIINDLRARYPNAVPPSRVTIWRQADHLEKSGTLHNLNSKVNFHEVLLSFICFPAV